MKADEDSKTIVLSSISSSYILIHFHTLYLFIETLYFIKNISNETSIMLAKACEIFIEELTLRACKIYSWSSFKNNIQPGMHSEENRRRTLQKSDISQAISKSDMVRLLLSFEDNHCITFNHWIMYIICICIIVSLYHVCLYLYMYDYLCPSFESTHWIIQFDFLIDIVPRDLDTKLSSPATATASSAAATTTATSKQSNVTLTLNCVYFSSK